MTEDRLAEPLSHSRPRVPVRLQCGAIRVVGLANLDRRLEEVGATVRR